MQRETDITLRLDALNAELRVERAFSRLWELYTVNGLTSPRCLSKPKVLRPTINSPLPACTIEATSVIRI